MKKVKLFKTHFFISCYTNSWYVHSQSQILHSYLQLNKWLLKINIVYLKRITFHQKKSSFHESLLFKLNNLKKWYTTWHIIKCNKILQDIIKNRQNSLWFKSVTVLGENKIYSKTHIRMGIGFQWWYAYNNDSIIQTQWQCQHCIQTLQNIHTRCLTLILSMIQLQSAINFDIF